MQRVGNAVMAPSVDRPKARHFCSGELWSKKEANMRIGVVRPKIRAQSSYVALLQPETTARHLLNIVLVPKILII